jgi:hypothetical protein
MRKWLLGGLIALLAASFAPAHAQEIFAATGAGQDAGASFFAETEDGVYFADMIGFSFNDIYTDTGPVTDIGACALVAFFPNPGHGHHAPPASLDIGCGTADVTIDPLLQTGTVVGSFDSELYDLDTGEFLGTSTMSVDVAFTAIGTPIAGAGEFADIFTFPFIDAGGGVVAATDAAADGAVTSAALGGLKGPAEFGFMEEGAGLFVFVAV